MNIIKSGILLLCIMVVASCGGGSSGGSTGPVATPTPIPTPIATQYPFSLTIDEESTQLGFSSFSPTPNRMRISGRYLGVKDGEKIYIGVDAPKDIFKDEVEIDESNTGGNGVFSILLEPIDNLFPGVYTGNFNLVTCADLQCNKTLGEGVYVIPFTVTFMPSDWYIALDEQMYNGQLYGNVEFNVDTILFEPQSTRHVRLYLPESVKEITVAEDMVRDLSISNLSRDGFDLVFPSDTFGDLYKEYDLSLKTDSGKEEIIKLQFDHDSYSADFDRTQFYVNPEDKLVAIAYNEEKEHRILIHNPLEEELRASVSSNCIFLYRLDVFSDGNEVDANGFDTLVGTLNGGSLFNGAETCKITLGNDTNIYYEFDLQITQN